MYAAVNGIDSSGRFFYNINANTRN